MDRKKWEIRSPRPLPFDELYFMAVQEEGVPVCRVSARDSNTCLQRACLVAAAPELLEACELTLSYMKSTYSSVAEDVLDSLSNAILRAKGEPK